MRCRKVTADFAERLAGLELLQSEVSTSELSPVPSGAFCFDVPQRLQRIVGSSANKTLVRGGCLDRLGEAETTVTRTQSEFGFSPGCTGRGRGFSVLNRQSGIVHSSRGASAAVGALFGCLSRRGLGPLAFGLLPESTIPLSKRRSPWNQSPEPQFYPPVPTTPRSRRLPGIGSLPRLCSEFRGLLFAAAPSFTRSTPKLLLTLLRVSIPPAVVRLGAVVYPGHSGAGPFTERPRLGACLGELII